MFFKNELKKRIKNEKGLTLIELLAVIVILAIIAAIAIPAIGNIIANSRSKAVISDAQNILSAANMYFTDNNTKVGESVELGAAGTADSLLGDGFLDNAGKVESAKVTKATGGNTIEFTAEFKGEKKTVTGTLEAINAIKVKKGEISAGTPAATIK